jgi:hypothetical protein
MKYRAPETKVAPDAKNVHGIGHTPPVQQNALGARAGVRTSMERETGFEPATSTLARSHSTTELLPLSKGIINERLRPGQSTEVTKLGSGRVAFQPLNEG